MRNTESDYGHFLQKAVCHDVGAEREAERLACVNNGQVWIAKRFVEEAMKMLESFPCGGVGKDGPTIEELDSHAERTYLAWEDNSDYHCVQYAWRKLERAMEAMK